MCGIAGYLTRQQGGERSQYDAFAGAMARAIAHRGPDDHGVWSDPAAGVALSHRRLSIVDLSPAGHQPMASHCGRYVIVFNGEIYNHPELRGELERNRGAPNWRGHSDTETLLALIADVGVERGLQACVGMFALALWDRRDRTLTLARDRMGEKPLYYGWQDGAFLFGSELRALRAHPNFAAQPSHEALGLLLRLGYVPTPFSIFENIKKLAPGFLLTVALDSSEAIPRSYWSFAEVASLGAQNQFSGTEEEACGELHGVLRRAVAGQMMSDVPLGALLSGGIDSSLIVALMQEQSARPVKTFTIGFSEREYDESAHARSVARHLGTDHTELILSASDALDIVPELPKIYDEPFADSSQLPTHLVMRLARRNVTVALSGDGGDEMFGGYNRYRLVPALSRRLGWLPARVRRGLASTITSMDAARWSRLLRPVAPALRVAQPGDKLHKLAERLNHVESQTTLFLSLVSQWQSVTDVVPGAGEPQPLVLNALAWPQIQAPAALMMAVDALTYLPDDVLTKVDRASMAVSLETRAPFLDRGVVEFAARMPLHSKLRGGVGKWALRQVLYQYVPQELVDRPKMGFGVPLDLWLRGPLRDWADSLLQPTRLVREGYFSAAAVTHVWDEHKRGASHGTKLWPILMFQSWLTDSNEIRRVAA